MSIEYGRLDASFCTLFWSRTPALSYTCTALLPPHALTSTRKNTATIGRKPFLSHGAEFIPMKVTPPSILNTLTPARQVISKRLYNIIPSYLYVHLPRHVLFRFQ